MVATKPLEDSASSFKETRYDRLFLVCFEKLAHGRFNDHFENRKLLRRKEGYVGNKLSYREEHKAGASMPVKNEFK